MQLNRIIREFDHKTENGDYLIITEAREDKPQIYCEVYKTFENGKYKNRIMKLKLNPDDDIVKTIETTIK